MKHWTTSNIKGGKEFSFTDLWSIWVDGYRKVKYNETNWISDANNLFTINKTQNLFDKIPFMSTTNKLCVLLVNIDKSSTTPLKQIRLSAYDPDTGAELAYTRTNAISSTSKQSLKKFKGSSRFLSYTYSILTFTPSTTYVNDSGYPIKKRINLKVEVLDGSTWRGLDGTTENGFLKFIEIGTDGLTGGNAVPVYNQTIPNQFFSSFYGLATGDLYDDSTGLRYLNYIIPSRQGSASSLSTWVPASDNILNEITNVNKSVSKLDTDYYTTTRVIKVDDITTVSLKYKIKEEMFHYTYAKTLATSYNNWKEYKIVYDLDEIYEETKNLRLEIYKNGSTTSECINIASSSMLPGFEETSLNKIWEFCLPAGTQAHRQPVDNISMSIIENTFKLPFWKYKKIDEVVKFLRSDWEGSSAYYNYYSVLENNGYFDTILQLVNTGNCDIVETAVGFYCKFSF